MTSATLIDANSIICRYQPIVRLRDGLPIAAEVLTRLAGPDGTVAGPEALVAALHDPTESLRLTRLVIESAAADAERENLTDLPLSFGFNLPLDVLMAPKLLETVETMRCDAGAAVHSVSFELTETRPIEDFERVHPVIEALREAGYRLALDDVTQATPNLQELLALPFRAVKLDRSEVAGAAGDPDSVAFIREVVALAGPSRMAVIAEGVEDEPTLHAMHQLGVTHVQGYLLARPLPPAELRPWLEAWPSNGLFPLYPV